MRVRDLAGPGQPPVIQIEAAPVYELLLSLYTFYSPEEMDSYDVGPAWFEQTRSRAEAALSGELEQAAASLGHMWPHLVGLAYETAPPRDIPAFLAHLAATPALELRLHVMGYYHSAGHHHVPRDVLRRAAEGDPAAQEEYLRPLDAHPEKMPVLRYMLSLPPDETKRLVLAVLRRWYEAVFRVQEPEVAPILARDAEAKRRLIPLLSPEQLIERATNGVQYTREAGIRRILLIPSVVLRPWVLITEHGDAKIVFYSVADESLSPGTELSAARLSKLYKALSDERRLQILQRIATASCTQQEIADDLGIGKSLVHHHLLTLRAAGLIGVSMAPDKRYSLRADAVAGVADALAAYLTGQAGAAAPAPRRPSRPRPPRRPSAAAQRKGSDDGS